MTYSDRAFGNGAVLASPLPSTVLASSPRPLCSPSRERTNGRGPVGRSIVLAARGRTLTGHQNQRPSTAAVTSLADAIEQALPGLGRPGAYDVILAAYSLAGPLWQVANPPKKLADAYAEAKAPDLSPDWNIDFTSALTRLITATCVGLMAEPAESNPG